MMKLKLSLKNSAKSALLFSIFSITLTGCYETFEPTYKERDIPNIVKRICKEEYNLDVTTKRTSTTLWIYAPVEKMLHKDFGIKEDKIFDDEMSDKSRNILTAIGRVLISSDKPPEFYALLVSDTNLGLDYTIIGNVLDMKKSFSGAVPWTEANQRYVIKFKRTSEAIGDITGRHLEAYDVTLQDFLAEQMAQRINVRFQQEDIKKYFKVEKSEGTFINDTFFLRYSIEQVLKSDKEIDTKKEILDIITYCIKTYEFRDFSTLELNDLIMQDKIVLNNAAIWGRSTP